MIRSVTAAALVCLLSEGATAANNYRKTDRGVEVTLYQIDSMSTRNVRLQVLGEKLIRVSATPDASFADSTSLVVVPQSTYAPYKVTEGDGKVSVTTASITASVNLATGDVSFYDKNGNLVLAEEARSFKPIEVEGRKAYTVTQRWESLDDDEGYYGLGQHQAD